MSHKLMKMTVNQPCIEYLKVYMKTLDQDDVGASTYIVVNLLQKRVPEVVERRFL